LFSKLETLCLHSPPLTPFLIVSFSPSDYEISTLQKGTLFPCSKDSLIGMQSGRRGAIGRWKTTSEWKIAVLTDVKTLSGDKEGDYNIHLKEV
jgi:hypothetical protein